MLRSVRSSSVSNWGRTHGIARVVRRCRLVDFCFLPNAKRLIFAKIPAMMNSLLKSNTGPRYNGKHIAPGAQTSRPEDAEPVRGLLGGRTAPAVFFEFVNCPVFVAYHQWRLRAEFTCPGSSMIPQ